MEIEKFKEVLVKDYKINITNIADVQALYLKAMNDANEVVVQELKAGCKLHGIDYVTAIMDKVLMLEISQEKDEVNTRTIRFMLELPSGEKVNLVSTRDSYKGVEVFKEVE